MWRGGCRAAGGNAIPNRDTPGDWASRAGGSQAAQRLVQRQRARMRRARTSRPVPECEGRHAGIPARTARITPLRACSSVRVGRSARRSAGRCTWLAWIRAAASTRPKSPVVVSGNLATQGQNLVDTGRTISVGTGRQPVVISTSQPPIPSPQPPLSLPIHRPAADLTLTAKAKGVGLEKPRTITVASDSQLLAQGVAATAPSV